MKQCPKCGTTYTDRTLTYCLADGSVLTDLGSNATISATPTPTSRPTGTPIRVEIPQNSVAGGQTSYSAPPAESGSSWMKIILIVGLVAVMLIAAAGFAGALIYFNKDSRTVADQPNKNTNVISNSDNASPTPQAANTDLDRMREQIANLERQLNESKNSNQPPFKTPEVPDQPVITSRTARVDSPGDGFLALRNLPSSDIGERIARIPNGATIPIGGCLPRMRIGKRAGRWCKASYGGYSGWVFDAWLIYIDDR